MYGPLQENCCPTLGHDREHQDPGDFERGPVESGEQGGIGKCFDIILGPWRYEGEEETESESHIFLTISDYPGR